MASTIADLTDGVTADVTDRIPIARTPFASGDNRYITPPYIRTHILALAAAWSVNGAASTPASLLSGTWFTGGSATTTKPQSLVEPAGTASTGWSTAGTGFGVNAPSGFAGNLLDLQVNGAFQLRVTAAGNIVSSAAAHTWTGASSLFIDFTTYFDGTSTANAQSLVGSGMRTASGHSYGWSSTSVAAGTPDVLLFRDAAGIFAQRNGVNAQAFRVYSTFTDSSNYERGALNAGADYIELAAETAGTGDDDMDVRLTPAGTGNVRFGAFTTDAAAITHTGYITIKDAGGTTRKLAVVS